MKTVLIVDDHEDSRAVYFMILEYAGYRVLEAASGAAGRRVLDANHVDLLLLDRNLPDMDGLKLFEEVDLDDVCVATLTANASPEAEIAARSVGCRAALVKPMAPRELREAVRSLIGPPQRTG